MLTHYLLIAARNLARHRFNTLISVIGLALGLACFIGARLFVWYVDGADSQFPNSERIFVVYQTSRRQALGLDVPFDASVTPLIAERLRIDYPQIEAIARSKTQPRTIVTIDGSRTFERVQYLDPEFLDIFTLDFIAGTARDLESSARRAILTEPAARSLFGTADVVGRSLHIEPVGDVEIAGVITPIPDPSHLAAGTAAASERLATESFNPSLSPAGPRTPSIRPGWPCASSLAVTLLVTGAVVTAHLLGPRALTDFRTPNRRG